MTPIKPKETPEKLRTLIETVCAPVHDESPEDWILSERLEEKETLMMEGTGVSHRSQFGF